MSNTKNPRISKMRPGTNDPALFLTSDNNYYKFYIIRRNIIGTIVKISITFLSQLLNFSSDINNINVKTIDTEIKKFNTNYSIETNIKKLFNIDNKNIENLLVSDFKINGSVDITNILSINKILNLFVDIYLKLYLENVLTKSKYNKIKQIKLGENLSQLLIRLRKNSQANVSSSGNLPSNSNNVNKNVEKIVEDVDNIGKFKEKINKYNNTLIECLELIKNPKNDYQPINNIKYDKAAEKNIKDTVKQLQNDYKKYCELINNKKNNKEYFYNFIIHYLNIFTDVYKLYIYMYECKYFCTPQPSRN